MEVCLDAEAELSHRMSQALLTPSVQSIFLPSKSGPYIPEAHMQKEGGVEREGGRMEREGGMKRLSEEDFPVCVCGFPLVKPMSKHFI